MVLVAGYVESKEVLSFLLSKSLSSYYTQQSVPAHQREDNFFHLSYWIVIPLHKWNSPVFSENEPTRIFSIVPIKFAYPNNQINQIDVRNHATHCFSFYLGCQKAMCCLLYSILLFLSARITMTLIFALSIPLIPLCFSPFHCNYINLFEYLCLYYNIHQVFTQLQPPTRTRSSTSHGILWSPKFVFHAFPTETPLYT